MLFERLIVHDDRAPASAAMNMAIDEALLEQCTLPGPALLRLARGRRSPSATSANLPISPWKRRTRVVRRWTGGGSVLHGEDLTYSLVTPASDPASPTDRPLIYAALHGAIRDALRAEGQETELAARAAPKISDACFANPVRDDLMLPRSQDRRGRPAPDARRLSPSGQHPTSRPVQSLPRPIRVALFAPRRSSIRIEIPPRVSSNAPPSWLAEKYGTGKWLRRW